MTKFLVLQWNGCEWQVDNSPHAIVAAGPYDTIETAVNAIEKRAQEDYELSLLGDTEEEAQKSAQEVRELTKVIPVEWPEKVLACATDYVIL